MKILIALLCMIFGPVLIYCIIIGKTDKKLQEIDETENDPHLYEWELSNQQNNY